MAPRASSRRSGKPQHSLDQEDRGTRVRDDVACADDDVERAADPHDVPQRA